MPFAVASFVAPAIGAIGSIAGSVISGNAATDAANTQASAANNATQLQQNIYNQTQSNLQPYLQGGNNALKTLLAQIGVNPDGTFNPNAPLSKEFTASQFQNSPGYGFQLQQGLDAVQNSAAARGGVVSGNTLKALTQYGQGLANQDYYNARNAYAGDQNSLFNRLYSLAGIGQNAAANLGGFGADFGNRAGSNIIGAGNAQAAGQIGVGNAIGGGINSLAQLAFLNYGNTGYGGTDGTVAYPSSQIGSYVDPGLSGTQEIYSDRRLKNDIEPIAKLPNGLILYAFRYLGDMKRRVGLMADEVEKLKPGAVTTDSRGWKMVNYREALA